MTLSLEVEWLTGVCQAARDPADSLPDWPVQPDRIFSALVASWGLTGAEAKGRAALEWLERQPPPRLRAVEGWPRTTVTAFVPPNDTGPTDIRSLPERRRRQPRQFPARVLGAATVHLRLDWETAPDPETTAALDRLARDTAYIGHSTAVVRCTVRTDQADAAAHLPEVATRAAPGPGRLVQLEGLHDRHTSGDERARARPTPLLAARTAPAHATPASVFGERWTVLIPQGRAPELIAVARLAGALHRRLIGAWPNPVPEWLSGHAAHGDPSALPHLAVAPLANVGFQHSDGALKGLALVLPRAVEGAMTADTPGGFALREAFDAAVANAVEQWPWARDEAQALASLKPARYLGPSTRFATVSPIALDRHLKGDWRDEAPAQIAAACVRIGLPAPKHVAVAKHSAVRGAPAAWPIGGAPAWTGWARPSRLGARRLVHALIEFDQPVRGPVVLGAGRFRGLGLCLPLGEP